MISSRNILKIFLNTLLGYLLVLIWLHFVNIQEIFQQISKVSPLYIFSFIFLYLLAGVCRATRLKLLLKEHKLSLKELIPLNYLCQFLSFAIPIRAGEIAKSVYLADAVARGPVVSYPRPMSSFISLTAGTRQGTPTSATPRILLFSKSLVWVFLDRFLDFLGMVTIVAILIFQVPNNLPVALQKTVAGLFIFFVFLTILMIISQRLTKKLINLIVLLLFFKKIQQFFLKFSSAIVEEFPILFVSPGRFLALCFLTILAIASDTINIYLLLTAVGIHVAFSKALLGSALTILTFLIPSAPGYVGSSEAAGVAIYSGGLGISANLVSAAIVFSHILNLVFVPAIGLIALYFLKFDLSEVWSKLKRD